ncbi:MAG: protein-L-isoaspartate(D-aspartate) O-methyltransferase [Chitinivibrionales bacterium]|nr:protein-L-isoaspartate(D-aspartate) O-methyltransferase [Chitinivibrionales bacterium]
MALSPPLKPEIACEKLIKNLRSKGIADERVLAAFRKVPRHLFIDKALYEHAFDDTALPIGNGQTISQPYIVAYMTELLKLEPDEKILEIGTGSGFQTAILAQFSRRVYTVERDAELGTKARNRLRSMGYENVVFKIGDGSKGWIQNEPYDKIIVTAAAPAVPTDLLSQLAQGGILVIPTGGRLSQDLEVYEKSGEKVLKSRACGVVFVPLIGDQGWNEKG